MSCNLKVGDSVKVVNTNCISYGKIGTIKKIDSYNRIHVLFSEYIGNSIYKTLTLSHTSLELVYRVTVKETDYSEVVSNNSSDEKYSGFVLLCENLGRITVHTINHPNDTPSRRAMDNYILELFYNYSEEDYAQNKIRQYLKRFNQLTNNCVRDTAVEKEVDGSETQCFCIVWIDDTMYMKAHGTKEEIETKVTPIVARLKINGEDVKITFTTEPKPVTVDVDDEGNMKLRRG